MNKPTPLPVEQRVRALREGANVQRFHTIPTIGDASVGKHSWGVASLILELNPNPSVALLRAALYHDAAGERFAGDVPGQIGKWVDPVLGERQNQVEALFAAKVGISIELNAEEMEWLKSCDMLELFMFAQDQIALGNRNMYQPRNRAKRWAEQNAMRMPSIVYAAFQWEWERVDDEPWWPEINQAVKDNDFNQR